MNQTQSYMEVHPTHMPSAPSYSAQPPAPPPLGHYNHYPSTVMAPSQYAPAASSYPYAYGNVTSPQSATHPPMSSQVNGQLLPLPPVPASAHGYVSGPSGSGQSSPPFDTTGQVPPPGIKPRVTATLWEDEGSLCFQVEARGICVARRDDNDMINGTKLLNVAGMTRGRRDGILKSEKLRHVVKIGPMHLKGVWIPYERALEFANKEKITDLLYPLFVQNIGSLLMHPQNPSRANALIAASERRRLESRTPAITTQAQAPTLTHHSMGAPQQLPAPLGHSRHESGRSHTFPTPPGSSASVLNGHGSGYEWAGSVQSQQPLSIDTSMAAARSLPATPATTPPGPPVHGIPSYQNGGSYDAKPYYTTSTSSASQYPGHPSLAHASHADGDNHQDGHGEYMSSASYASNRASYPYSAPAPVGALTNDSPQVSPIVTESGPSESRPERIHSRHGSQSHWSYPRTGGSSNVYSVMSDPRAADSYSAGAGSTYASASVNGYSKRSREEDPSADSKILADAQTGDSTEGKRRRTLVDATRPSIALHTRPGSSSSVGRRL